MSQDSKAWPKRVEQMDRTVTTSVRPPHVTTLHDENACQVELERLTDAYERASVQNKLLKGQLSLYGGDPIEWPREHEKLREMMPGWVQEQLLASDDLALSHVDCEEYPCIAAIRYSEELSSSSTHVLPLAESFEEEFGGSSQARLSCDEEGCMAAVVFQPSSQIEEAMIPGLQTRIDIRAKALQSSVR